MFANQAAVYLLKLSLVPITSSGLTVKYLTHYVSLEVNYCTDMISIDFGSGLTSGPEM